MSHPNTEDPAPSQSDTVRATMGHCPSTLLIALLIAQLKAPTRPKLLALPETGSHFFSPSFHF